MEIDTVQKFITLVGRRGSGKSEMCRYLFMNEKHKYDGCFVISPTDFSGFWAKLVGKERVKDSYDEQWVNKLLDRMKTINEGKDKKSPQFKNVLLILDDVFGSVRGHELKTLTKICQAGRHYGVTIFAVAQYLTNISPSQRQNSDYIFFGKNNKASNDLLEKEFNLGLDRQQFRGMVERCSNDHNFLVINNNAYNVGDLNSVYGKMSVPARFLSKPQK